MKIYNVKVNGKTYIIELESVEEISGSIKTEKPTNLTQTNVGGTTIASPMQGTIQKILVKPGQLVKKGDSLLILEAMKLENDITADKDYKILTILVQEGNSVDSNQPLIKVE
ncbi:MAG: biotin/lipoyl-containing protein [Candidatus Izemoplasmatales bacterium]